MHTFEKSVNCIDTNESRTAVAGVIQRMPVATVTVVKNELRYWFETLRTWQIRARQRRHLATLDGRLLRDMGMTKADASLEASKPFWEA